MSLRDTTNVLYYKVINKLIFIFEGLSFESIKLHTLNHLKWSSNDSCLRQRKLRNLTVK